MSEFSLPTSSESPLSLGQYYIGDYQFSLNLYSFNVNIQAWVKGNQDAPQLDTLSAIKWAAQQGVDAVNIPLYYIPGYSNTDMPTASTASIKEFVHQVKETAAQLGLPISGVGIGNNFARPDPAAIALDIERAHFWIDRAAEMGSPLLRVFSGTVPADIDAAGGWEAVTQSRIVPALKDVAAYAADRGLKVCLQNHGDMTATADQTIQILKWVDHPGLVLLDDTGYFRPFRAPTGLDYDWYSDINKVLPYCEDIQVKIKPAGADQEVMMDYHRLFTGIRSSTYHGPINLERLWYKHSTGPENPKNRSIPPYDEVEQFIIEVREALEATKTPPVGA